MNFAKYELFFASTVPEEGLLFNVFLLYLKTGKYIYFWKLLSCFFTYKFFPKDSTDVWKTSHKTLLFWFMLCSIFSNISLPSAARFSRLYFAIFGGNGFNKSKWKTRSETQIMNYVSPVSVFLWINSSMRTKFPGLRELLITFENAGDIRSNKYWTMREAQAN